MKRVSYTELKETMARSRPNFGIVRYADHYEIVQDGKKVASGTYTYPQSAEQFKEKKELEYYDLAQGNAGSMTWTGGGK